MTEVPMSVDAIYEQFVKSLPVAERMRLVEIIAHDLTAEATLSPSTERPKWSDYRGMVQHPMCGEDAQAWVSRTRRESDESREKQLKHGT
jgi:hypothetical protein